MSSIDNPSWINADDVGGSRSGRVRRKIMIGMVGIAVVALVAAVAVTARGDTPRWRTALVGRHDVITSLSGVGTVEAVSQAAVAFPISGTVASVDVTEGQSVGVGQTLASLATTSLQQSLDEAQATATQAALALTQATTTTAAVPSSTASPTTSTSDTGATASGSDQRASGESGTNPALASAQSDLLHAQHEADARLSAAVDAVESVQQACSSSRPDGTGPPDPTTTSTTSTTMPSTPTTTTTTPGTGAPSDCQSALESAMSAQEAVSEAQHAVSQAATAFDALLADMTGTSAHGQGQQHASGDTTGSSTQTSAASATAGSGAVGAASGQRSQTTDGSGTSAAQTLITRQQSVDAANAAVAQATQALAQATIVSPMAGRVVAITLTVGESVTAASSTETVTVAGPAGSEVTMLVPVANLPSVRIGQTASVQPDGSNRSYPGKVVSIGLTPSSGQSTTVYPVSVALTSPTADPGFLGSTASVSIHIHSAPDAIAVPTSAVTANGSRHSVQVVRSGEVAAVPVTVGAVGPTWTQVTSGLRLGESVVLADFHLPLPGSATQSSSTGASGSGDRNRPGGFGGFGGRGPGD